MNAQSTAGPLQTPAEAARPLVSLPATACALLACAALFVTGGGAWALPICALALLWTHFVAARWSRDSFAPWIVRLIAFTFVTFGPGARSSSGSDGLLDGQLVNLIGALAAVELAIQHWRSYPETRFPPCSIALSGLVFLAACNTFDGRIVPIIGPIFVTLQILAMRDLNRARQLPATASKNQTRVRFQSNLAVAACLVFVLCGGALMHGAMNRYKSELMSLGMNILRDRPLPQSVGISDRPQLGSRFDRPDSPQRVLRIEGDLDDPHLRAASFDFYSNGSWGPSLAARKAATLSKDQLQSNVKGKRVAITRLLDIEGNYLFAPLNSAGIIAGGGNEIEGENSSGLLRCDEEAPYRYQIVNSTKNIDGVPVHQGPLCAPLDEEMRARYLQLPPEIDPRVRTLAVSIVQNEIHPATQVEAIAEYLLSNHRYSREARRGGGDPVSRFLLEKRSAHCEYFAAATAILARCAGVPSRYVVGYFAHESDGAGGVVRQRDAHAWAECWIEGVGWVTVDATPGDGKPEALSPVAPWQRAWEWLQDGLEKFKSSAVKLSPRQWIGIVGALVALWLLVRWRPAARSRAANAPEKYSSPAQRLENLATRFEKSMTRRGIVLSPAHSWPRALSDAEQAAAARWANEYERVRFGTPHDDAAINALETDLSPIESDSMTRKSS